MWKQEEKKRDLIFLVSFLISALILIWKAPYGFGLGWADEGYVLNTGHRLLFGDGLLVHEWLPAQLQGFLLYPILWLWRTVTGTSTGILLAMRYLHLALWSVVTLFLYKTLRDRPFGWAAALLFYFQAPLALMAFSYNTISLAGLVLTLMIFLKGRPGMYVIAGLSLAAAVLSTPTLLVWYLGYTAAVIVCLKREKRPACLEPGNWGRLTAGAALMAVPFLLFLLTRCGSMEHLILGIQQNVSDPMHAQHSVIYKIISYPYFILKYVTYLSVPGAACFLAAFWDSLKNNSRLKKPVFAMTVLVCALSAAYMAWRAANGIFSGGGEYGLFNLPPLVLGLVAFLYTPKKDWTIFRILFLNGVAYSFCIHYTSNLYIMAIVHGLSVSAMAALIFVGEFYEQEKKEHSGLAFLALMGCVLVLAGQVCCRVTRTVGSVRTADCTCVIQEGAAKGLKMPWQHQEEWDTAYDQAKMLMERMRPDDKVFFNTRATVLYLEADREYSGYSTWKLIPEQQLLYWQTYPEKIPDAACLYKNGEMDLDTFALAADLDDYTIVETENAWLLWRKTQGE